MINAEATSLIIEYTYYFQLSRRTEECLETAGPRVLEIQCKNTKIDSFGESGASGVNDLKNTLLVLTA